MAHDVLLLLMYLPLLDIFTFPLPLAASMCFVLPMAASSCLTRLPRAAFMTYACMLLPLAAVCHSRRATGKGQSYADEQMAAFAASILLCKLLPWAAVMLYRRATGKGSSFDAVLTFDLNCGSGRAVQPREALASPTHQCYAAGAAVTVEKLAALAAVILLCILLPRAAVLLYRRATGTGFSCAAELLVAAATMILTCDINCGFGRAVQLWEALASPTNQLFAADAAVNVQPREALALPTHQCYVAGAAMIFEQLAAFAAVILLCNLLPRAAVLLYRRATGKGFSCAAELLVAAAALILTGDINCGFGRAVQLWEALASPANLLYFGASAPHPPAMELAVKSYGGS